MLKVLRYLHRIGKSASPNCLHCPQDEETIHHLPFDCHHTRRERHILTIALGRKASSLPFLLANADAIPHLVRYINATLRLKATFGEVKMPVRRPD
ncbi:hypothetical protein M405DRAFT_815432 [Rhizopogon salebrosus TDB-379]|nr:hypothetical protein M405DRAFT_815432 [Rhizopogon salebrosus TDB-379]